MFQSNLRKVADKVKEAARENIKNNFFITIDFKDDFTYFAN